MRSAVPAVPGGPRHATARRRALLAASVAPVVAVSALAFFRTWPWRPAAGHLAALSLLGLILVELCAAGTPKIPFTCSYLPGKSRMHIAACVVALLLPLVIKAATFERDALRDPLPYAAMLAVLGVVWAGVRGGTSWLRSATGAQPEFEDEPAGQTLTLELWDSRFAVDPQRRV